MSPQVKNYLYHILVAALVGVLTAIINGPALPVAGGSLVALVARDLLPAAEKL